MSITSQKKQHEFEEFLQKVVRMHGVEPEQLSKVALSDWLNLEKGLIQVPK